jgi:predicted ester cyclase
MNIYLRSERLMQSIAHNKAVIRRVYEEGFSNDNVDIMDETFAESYICRFPDLAPVVGLAACKVAIGGFLRAFPAKYKIEHMVAEGDRVAARWSAVGVHAGEFHDLANPDIVYPATNRPVRFSATDIYRFEDGLIAEEWNSLEEHSLLVQIGALVPRA